MKLGGFNIASAESGELCKAARPIILNNGQGTFTCGCAVSTSPSTTVPGLIPTASASVKILGILQAFLDRNGVPYQISSANFGGTYTVATTGDVYVPTSSNVTVNKVVGIVVPVMGYLLSAKLDAAVGTTTGSDLAGNYFTLTTATSNSINEGSVTATIGTTQFQSVGYVLGSTSPIDPAYGSTTRIIVRCIATEESPA